MSINFITHFYEIFNISIYLQNNMYIPDQRNTQVIPYKLTNQPFHQKLTQPSS